MIYNAVSVFSACGASRSETLYQPCGRIIHYSEARGGVKNAVHMGKWGV